MISEDILSFRIDYSNNDEMNAGYKAISFIYLIDKVKQLEEDYGIQIYYDNESDNNDNYYTVHWYFKDYLKNIIEEESKTLKRKYKN